MKELDSERKMRILKLKVRIDTGKIKAAEMLAEIQAIARDSEGYLAKKRAENTAGFINSDTLAEYRTGRQKLIEFMARFAEYQKEADADIEELYSLMLDT
jgi:hypothetical protein